MRAMEAAIAFNSCYWKELREALILAKKASSPKGYSLSTTTDLSGTLTEYTVGGS